MNDRVLDIYSKKVDETVEKLLDGDEETLEAHKDNRKIQEELNNYRKNVIERYEDTSEDYLDEDSPVHGQKYCVLSFAEKANDLLTEEETFDFIHFMMNQSPEDFMKLMGRNSQTGRSEVLEESQESQERDPEKDHKALWGNDLENLDKKSWEKVEPKLNDKWEGLYFRILKAYTKFKRDNDVYLKNRYLTVFGEKRVDRLIKVRGSFKTIEKAQARVKELKMDDKYHTYYISEVGRWGQFNPPAWATNDYKTANAKMNELIMENRKEKDKAKNAFNLRKELLMRQAQKNNEEIKRKALLNNETSASASRSQHKLIEAITEEEYQEMLKDPSVKDLGLMVGSSKMKHNMEPASVVLDN